MKRVLCLFLATAGCASTPIEVHDSGVLQTGGRVLVRSTPVEGEPWTGVLVEVDWFEGEDEQGLALGQSVELDGVTFVGPDRLALEYELRRECLAYTFGSFHPRQGLETSVELGYARVVSELGLVGGSSRAEASDTWDGLHLAAGLLWAPVDWLGLEGRLGTIADFDDLGTHWETIELGTRLLPRSPLGVFAGWRWVDLYRVRNGESDLDFHADGPSLALRVTL